MTKDELRDIDVRKVMLVDIREADELLLQPAISGAAHIPMGNIVREAEDGNLPKDRKIVTVCRSGGRCMMVNQILSEMGYDVDFLEGGMNALC